RRATDRLAAGPPGGARPGPERARFGPVERIRLGSDRQRAASIAAELARVRTCTKFADRDSRGGSSRAARRLRCSGQRSGPRPPFSEAAAFPDSLLSRDSRAGGATGRRRLADGGIGPAPSLARAPASRALPEARVGRGESGEANRAAARGW